MMTPIVTWILLAINAWGASPIPTSVRDHVADVRLEVANEMMRVAYDPLEPPLYQGPYGRAMTAVTLTSIAALETRFVERIMRGKCRPYECDSGKAVGLLQVQIGPYGVRLSDQHADRCSRPAPDCLLTSDLVADPGLQIRVGLHVLRTLGFRAFTRADDIREQAATWIARHPPPVRDAEAMAP